MQATLLGVAGSCLALAVLAGLAERRRSRREGPARVGWVPWGGVTVTLLFAGVAALVIALKAT